MEKSTNTFSPVLSVAEAFILSVAEADALSEVEV
jgi:hypothetical protein